jgi:excisionase family DNA binding protein
MQPQPESDPLALDQPPWTVGAAEAARVLGIGRRQLVEKLRSGEIYSFRSGRSYRIPKTSLRRLLEGESAAIAARPALRIVGAEK